MKQQVKIESELLKAFALARLIPVRTSSYIGAGTGSLIIQAVIAACVGGAFALKIYWRRIKAFFLRRKEAVDDGQAEETAAFADAETPEEASFAGETSRSIEAELLPETVEGDSVPEPAEAGAVLAEGEERI